MKFLAKVSKPRLSQIFTDLFVNLASGWLGIILISPGLFGVSSPEEYLSLLTQNLPFSILSLVVAYWLSGKA